MSLLDNTTWSYDIFDARGKYIGFDSNQAEAEATAAAVGGKAVAVEVIDNAYNDEHYAGGCPCCGSYEGDSTECPECGHGQ